MCKQWISWNELYNFIDHRWIEYQNTVSYKTMKLYIGIINLRKINKPYF